MIRPKHIFATVLVLLVAGCGDAPEVDEPVADPTPEQPEELVDPTAVEYAEELEIDFDEMQTTELGVYYRVDQPGDGEVAEEGRSVTVHYRGSLVDGTVFEDSREMDQPITVELGAQEVIQGWEDGIMGMQVGEQRTLVIPPHLAYGAAGAGEGVIPPNAVLVFQVEVVEIH